jgi:hypothetical protein
VAVRYDSTVEAGSERAPGVKFVVERMSFGRRLELIRALKEHLGRLEFVAAAPEGPARQAEAALAAGEIDRIYLKWGLRSVSGLVIDGEPVTPETLVERGPEELVEEALAVIRRETGLTEAERKNSGSPSTSCEASRPGGSATTAGS